MAMATPISDNTIRVKIMSFNMHGFHQGCPVLDDMIELFNPDVLLLQEHWLTPANLNKFDSHFTNYFSFGCSAMSTVVETGMLRGRPFGGVICLVKNNLRSITHTIHCDDRFAIIKIGNCIIINVYLPCIGSTNREIVCEDLLSEVDVWCQANSDCNVVIAGDFNTDLDSADNVARSVTHFAECYSLLRCDNLSANNYHPTYVNLALNQQSRIDYILASPDCNVRDFTVVDPDINFSDHLPLFADIKCSVSPRNTNKDSHTGLTQKQLRWDQADLASYYYHSGSLLNPLLAKLDDFLIRYDKDEVTVNDIAVIVERAYHDITDALASCAKQFVPERKKSFYKFWWDEELDILKQASIDSNRLWTASGKPRHGPIFDKRQKARLQYRNRIREGKRTNDQFYTNELHDALLRKDGPAFWKCWRSKFTSNNKCPEVEGHVDADIIAEKFVQHFSKSYSCNNEKQQDALREDYCNLRVNYTGFTVSDQLAFNTEIVSKIIHELKGGKAADIDGLTSEHLLFSHPVLVVIISRLFQLILHSQYIPSGFKRSYIVPIPKPRDTRTKAMMCDDFRGIAITPILCKVFEYCFLDRFHTLLLTGDNQFGFKKGIGCTHAIYSCRNIVDHFVNSGSTVNICALDLSKAFDKVNHHALFIKLMRRHIPVKLLTILENLFSCCYSCIKWDSAWSTVFEINFGVRQGSVLSPFLFAVYLDDLSKLCSPFDACYIILYADDILLISPSITNLERLLHRCEHELAWLDMSINLKNNHPVYESALAVMQRVLSLLVLQVAAYHGWRKFGTSGALCQIKVAQVLVGRGQARIFFVPLMLFLERLEG